VTPRQAGRLKKAVEARWPEAADVDVKADADGARVRLRIEGRLHLLSVAENGTLMRLLLLGPS
jgi:type II secretory ATPase GspE/PulE/Tfp pilus assembly ATPase PilB-like protein